MVVLTTPRLVVTSWLADDVDDLYDVHSDPETMKFVRHGRPESLVETRQLVDIYMAEHADRGWTKWRLTDAEGVMIGRAGFGGSADNRGLSYLVRRSHWGRGLATEVAAALVDWHSSHVPAVPLSAIVAVPNLPSARVLQKIGFHEAGSVSYDGMMCRSFTYPTSRNPKHNDNQIRMRLIGIA